MIGGRCKGRETFSRAILIVQCFGHPDLDVLYDAESELMQWKETASTISVFPIVDTIFTWIDSINPDIQSMLQMIEKQNDFDVGGVKTFWDNIQKYRDTWYTILGKK